MKKFLAIVSLVSVLSVPQYSQAACGGGYRGELGEAMMYIGFLMIGSITSAPTGTSMTLSLLGDCREEALAVQEDAKQFAIGGEASPLLQTAFAGAKEAHPEMSNEEMAVHFINLNLSPKGE
jgi:hypothetical protein